MAGTVIAAQLYTVREYMQKPSGIAESLQKIKEIGYDVVQLSGHGEIDNNELKKYLDDAGLNVCATHVSFDMLRNETEKAIEYHTTIGCSNPAIGGLPREYRNSEGYRTFAQLANETGEKLAEYGLNFGYHNHNFELAKFDGITGLEIIYDNTDPAFLKAEIDTYWIQAGGGDPVWWLKRLSGRVPYIHVKDMGMNENGEQVFKEVGEGNLNWEALFAQGRESGVEHYIVEQDTCEGDPFDSLKISLENMKAMGLA